MIPEFSGSGLRITPVFLPLINPFPLRTTFFFRVFWDISESSRKTDSSGITRLMILASSSRVSDGSSSKTGTRFRERMEAILSRITSRWSGFSRKSRAPSLIALTADSIPACPLIIKTGRSGWLNRRLSSTDMPSLPGSQISSSTSDGVISFSCCSKFSALGDETTW